MTRERVFFLFTLNVSHIYLTFEGLLFDLFCWPGACFPTVLRLQLSIGKASVPGELWDSDTPGQEYQKSSKYLLWRKVWHTLHPVITMFQLNVFDLPTSQCLRSSFRSHHKRRWILLQVGSGKCRCSAATLQICQVCLPVNLTMKPYWIWLNVHYSWTFNLWVHRLLVDLVGFRVLVLSKAKRVEVGHTVVGRLEPEKAGCLNQREPRHASWISYWISYCNILVL